MAKQNFNEKLIILLKTHPDLVDESGELLPAAVKDHAWQLDHNLICEQMHYVETVTRERVKKVIERDNKGNFIYCELM